eukprot:5338462-Amphidinium_carterae.2
MCSASLRSLASVTAAFISSHQRRRPTPHRNQAEPAYDNNLVHLLIHPWHIYEDNRVEHLSSRASLELMREHKSSSFGSLPSNGHGQPSVPSYNSASDSSNAKIY